MILTLIVPAGKRLFLHRVQMPDTLPVKTCLCKNPILQYAMGTADDVDRPLLCQPLDVQSYRLQEDDRNGSQWKPRQPESA